MGKVKALERGKGGKGGKMKGGKGKVERETDIMTIPFGCMTREKNETAILFGDVTTPPRELQPAS